MVSAQISRHSGAHAVPGLVGLITRMPRADAELRLNKMLNAIRHEEFYAFGTWVDESLGAYIGWTALKGSFSDGMPLHSDKRDAHLVFSGEDYSVERIAPGRASANGSG